MWSHKGAFLYSVLHMCSSFGGHKWGMTQKRVFSFIFLSELFELLTGHKSVIFVSLRRWNHYIYSPRRLPELSVDCVLMLVTLLSWFLPPLLKSASTVESSPFLLWILFILWFFLLLCRAGPRAASLTAKMTLASWILMRALKIFSFTVKFIANEEEAAVSICQ